MQPDSLPQDVDQLVALFADVTPRTQGFYKSTFSKTEVTPGPGYLERLAESLHRQGENLLALMIIERWFVSSYMEAMTRSICWSLGRWASTQPTLTRAAVSRYRVTIYCH